MAHGQPTFPGPTRRASLAASDRTTALANHSTTVALGCATPDARLLANREGVVKARVAHSTLAADRLGLLGKRIVAFVGIEDRRVKATTCPEIPPFQFLYRHVL